MPDYPISSYDGNQIGMPRWPDSSLVAGICGPAVIPPAATPFLPPRAESHSPEASAWVLLVGLIAAAVLLFGSGDRR